MGLWPWFNEAKLKGGNVNIQWTGKSVELYEVELWRWKKYEGLECLHKRYIKLTLTINRNTLEYTVRKEINMSTTVCENKMKNSQVWRK